MKEKNRIRSQQNDVGFDIEEATKQENEMISAEHIKQSMGKKFKIWGKLRVPHKS